eukprot:2417843-Pleurochrysis_carterae.AAC.1
MVQIPSCLAEARFVIVIACQSAPPDDPHWVKRDCPRDGTYAVDSSISPCLTRGLPLYLRFRFSPMLSLVHCSFLPTRHLGACPTPLSANSWKDMMHH